MVALLLLAFPLMLAGLALVVQADDHLLSTTAAGTGSCAQGSYYRKVASLFGNWQGIQGVVRLGTPQVDPGRVSPIDGGYLDNFSVYMGGNAGGFEEIDAGLTWEWVRTASGRWKKAWRPFWRNQSWSEAPPEIYWEPGDTVVMSVTDAGPGKLRLYVADAGANPGRSFSKVFAAPGFQPYIARQFKRVNAIDQVGREGKPVEPTSARVTGATWEETELLEPVATGLQPVPLSPARRIELDCPPGHDRVTATPAQSGRGAESIDIYGEMPPAPVPNR